MSSEKRFKLTHRLGSKACTIVHSLFFGLTFFVPDKHFLPAWQKIEESFRDQKFISCNVLLNSNARAWQRFIAAVAFTSQLDSLHDFWNNLRGGSFCAVLLIIMGKKKWLIMVMIQTASFFFMKSRNYGIVSWMIWVHAIVGVFMLVTASKHFIFVIFHHLLTH